MMTNPWLFVSAYLSIGIAFTAFIMARIDADMTGDHPAPSTLAMARIMSTSLGLTLLTVICVCFWIIICIESFWKKGKI